MNEEKKQHNKSFKEEKQLEMEKLVKDRGHILLEGVYVNNTSRFIVFCPIHQRRHETSLFNYKRSKKGIICCSKPIVIPRNAPTNSQDPISNNALSTHQLEKQAKTNEKAILNGHIIEEGFYQTRFSPLKVFCTKHHKVHETNYYNYNRSQAGLPCCKNVQRDSRGGQPRDWRRTSKARNWRNQVVRIWEGKCAITGKSLGETNLVCHHFFNAHNGDTFSFSLQNSILLQKHIHEDFHRKYGYRNNTLDQFLDYLSFLRDTAEFEKAKIQCLSLFLEKKKKDILLDLGL